MRIGIYGGTFNPPHIGHVVFRGGFVRAEVVKVEPDYVHPFVAGVAFEITGLVLDVGRRVAVKNVVYTACVAQVADGHPPQCLILVGRCEIGTPPEPRPGLLVVETQYNGNRFALRIFQRCQEVRHPIQPREVFVVVRSAR